MELKANYAKIVGTPAVGRDSWVYVEDDFFLILTLSGYPPFPLATYGKEIISSIASDYKKLSQKNLANLRGLVDGVKVIEGITPLAVLGVKVGKVFYLVCRGGGKVILKRGGKFGIILEGEGSASGILEDKDIFVLISPRFGEIVSFEEVKSVFDTSASSNFSPSELAEGLTPLIHRAEDTSGAAALILQFEETAVFSGEAGFGGAKEETRVKLIKQKLSSIIHDLFSIFQNSLRQPISPEEKKKRIVFWVALILVILLGASIIFGLGKRENERKGSRLNQTYELALHQYEEGKALIGLNNPKAISLFGEGKRALAELKKDFGKGKEAKKIDELLKEIEGGIEMASQVYKLKAEVFLDLGLIKEGGEGQSLAISGENLAVLDRKNLSLYQISIKQKSSQILAGGEKITGAKLVALGEDRAYVLTGEGVVEIDLKTKAVKPVIKKDNDWGEIKAIAAYGGNLYLVDATYGKIWKYTGAEVGFSEKKNYLIGEPAVNFTGVNSASVDGSVWLATDRILKFTQGKQDNFQIQGLDQPLGQKLIIFSSEDTKNLYLLDLPNNRIVVIEKTGTYQSQYVLEGITGISDMVVSESEKKIFLLSGNKIYEIKLKT